MNSRWTVQNGPIARATLPVDSFRAIHPFSKMPAGNEIGQAIRTFEEIRRLLGTLSEDARNALMSELNRPTSVPRGNTVNAAPAGNNQKFTDVVLALLSGSKHGMTLEELAPALYPDRELSRAKHNARALLALLAGNNRVHQLGGRWLAGPSKVVAKKTETGRVAKSKQRGPKKKRAISASDLCLQIVSTAPSKVSAADVVRTVQMLKPNVEPRKVYRELHTLAKAGKILQEMSDNHKAAYSPVNGAKKKQT